VALAGLRPAPYPRTHKQRSTQRSRKDRARHGHDPGAGESPQRTACLKIPTPQRSWPPHRVCSMPNQRAAATGGATGLWGAAFSSHAVIRTRFLTTTSSMPPGRAATRSCCLPQGWTARPAGWRAPRASTRGGLRGCTRPVFGPNCSASDQPWASPQRGGQEDEPEQQPWVPAGAGGEVRRRILRVRHGKSAGLRAVLTFQAEAPALMPGPWPEVGSESRAYAL
jgi:hypothetical protein